MSTRGIRAGKAHILLSIRNNVRQGLRTAERDLTQFAARTARLGTGLLAGAAGLAGAFAPAVREFARIEQLLGRFDSVFGNLTKSSGEFADSLAKDVNASGLEIRDALAQFQGIAVGQGFSPIEAEGISQELTRATFDLVAYDDQIGSVQEAVKKLTSVFTGETEPLRQYGTDFRKEALGISRSAKIIDRARAESSARLEQLRGVFARNITGQAAREVDTLASRLRGFRAALTDTLGSIGGSIAPVVVTLTGNLTQLVRRIGEFAESHPQAFQRLALAVPVVGAIGAGIIALSTSLAAIGFVVGGIATLGTTLAGLAIPAAVLASIAGGAYLVIQSFDSLRDSANTLVGNISKGLQSLRDTAFGVFDGIANALAGGDLQLAGKIGLKGLQIAFEQTFGLIREKYQDLVDAIARGLLKVAGTVGRVDMSGALQDLARSQEDRRNARQQRLADLRQELQALQQSAAAARDKATAERDAKSAAASPSVAVKRQQQQVSAIATQRIQNQGAFGGVSVAQQFSPQVSKLADILAATVDGNKIADRQLTAIEELEIRWS